MGDKFMNDGESPRCPCGADSEQESEQDSEQDSGSKQGRVGSSSGLVVDAVGWRGVCL